MFDSRDTATRHGGSGMPPFMRVTVIVGLGLALGSALFLFAVRGPALLLDLAAIGGMFLCF